VTQPWTDLPVATTAGLRDHLGDVAAAVVAALPAAVPSYARPLEGAFGEGVHRGVEVALARFLELPGTTEPALQRAEHDVYVALGCGEARQGRELGSLLAAYRVGARVAFRQLSALARAAGLDSDALVQLAESVFAYIEELSSASAEGYAREQSLRAGDDDRRRGELAALLLAGGLDAPAAAEAAARAGWALPEQLVVVVAPPEHAEGLGGRLGSALITAHGDAAVAVLAAPAGAAEQERLVRGLTGRRAVVGLPVPWSRAPVSLRAATVGARLLATGVLTGDPLLTAEHRAALVVHRDPDLVEALAVGRLAPLDALPAATAARLAETLLAWLRHRGERQRVADELHVHRQTVGYRLGQLRELLGAALDDPQARFELEVALRARSG